jgi:hypothetical protein
MILMYVFVGNNGNSLEVENVDDRVAEVLVFDLFLLSPLLSQIIRSVILSDGDSLLAVHNKRYFVHK